MGMPDDVTSLEDAEDADLLRRWADLGDGDAVRVLARRHAGMVTGAAARALGGDRSLAEEAAQRVFTVMAAKAGALWCHPALGPWLHRAALLEARALRRRESRRDRALRRVAEESPMPMDHTPDSPSREHLLAELDEALERLPDSDRHVLILRYYEGRGFREIGTRLGKSDDTVQKQATRALEKLSRILGRRGLAVPGAVAGAVLASAGSASTASAAGIAKCAAAAVTGAPRMGVAGKVWHSLQFMSYGKSTTWAVTAAALLLMALSAVSGYRAGAAAAPAEGFAVSANDHTVSNRLSGAGGALSPAGVSGKSSQSSGAVSGGPPLLDILRAAASIKMDLAGEWSVYSEDMYPVLGLYRPEDAEDAIDLLGEFHGEAEKFESVAGLIFSAMAAGDWRAARARILAPDALRQDGAVSGQALRAVAEAWGREDPAAAFRWANGLIDSGETPCDPQRGVGEKLLADWLGRDPDGAVAEMERRLASQTPLVGKAVAKSIEERPQWWLDRLAATADPATRERFLRLARGGLVLLPAAERSRAVAAWVTDPALAAELLEIAP